MEIFGVVFVIVWCWLAYNTVKTLMNFNKEKKAYTVMISNPCNATVSQYLGAYAKTNTGFANFINNTNRGVQHRNDQLRQSQGWSVIRDCDTVSEELKQQLRNSLIAQGVPMKDIAN